MGKRRKQTKDQILSRMEENTAARVLAHREAERLRATGAEATVTEIDEKGEDGVTRKKTVVMAKRKTCFDTVLAPDSVERKAVDWLETTIGIANGENTPERRPDYIRASTEGAPGQNVSQVMIAASIELQTVEDNLFPMSARLLFGLLRPNASLTENWRGVVQDTTGEKNDHAQAAMVRAAAANLLWVKDNLPRLLRERRERKQAA